MNATLLACAVCMTPGHPTAEAIGFAILLMLSFLVPVLGGFLYLIVYLARRSKRVNSISDTDLDTLSLASHHDS